MCKNISSLFYSYYLVRLVRQPISLQNNLQNKENVESIELVFNGDVVNPKSEGVWEMYQVAGTHKVVANYVEKTGIEASQSILY